MDNQEVLSDENPNNQVNSDAPMSDDVKDSNPQTHHNEFSQGDDVHKQASSGNNDADDEQDEQLQQPEEAQAEDDLQQIEDDDEQADEQEIIPNSKPPTVPDEGTYIDALNEAGVDPQRIEQLQQSKFHFRDV